MKPYPRPDGHTPDLFGGPMEPWITRGAIKFLESYLTKDMVVAEFGSGSSTRWIAKRVKKLTSIENDKSWYNEVLEDIRDLVNVDYRLIEYSDIEESKIKAVNAIGSLTNLDFVLVDGRLRVRTILANYDKIKIGGILMLDNAERYFNAQGIPWYKKGIDFMDSLYNWNKTETNNGIIKTVWWTRES